MRHALSLRQQRICPPQPWSTSMTPNRCNPIGTRFQREKTSIRCNPFEIRFQHHIITFTCTSSFRWSISNKKLIGESIFNTSTILGGIVICYILDMYATLSISWTSMIELHFRYHLLFLPDTSASNKDWLYFVFIGNFNFSFSLCVTFSRRLCWSWRTCPYFSTFKTGACY